MSNQTPESSEAHETTEYSDNRTHQFMKGFTTFGVTMSLIYALEPYANTLAVQTVEYISLAALLVGSYGIFLAVTAPLFVNVLVEIEERFAGGQDE